MLEAVGSRTVVGGTLSLQYPRRVFFRSGAHTKKQRLGINHVCVHLLPFSTTGNTHFMENKCNRISEELIPSSSIQSLSPETCPRRRGPFIVGFGRREDRFQTPGAVCNKAPSALTQRR